jgi:hypothetical protein
MNNNGTKQILQKVLIYALVVIVSLVSVVFGITWTSTKNIAEKNSEDIVAIKEFIAAQHEINKKIDEILVEVKK